MMKPSNSVALVTGASSGIGYEFAKVLAAHKYNLVLLSRNLNKLTEIKEEIEQAHGVTAHLFPADLSIPDISKDVFDEVNNFGLTVDILINNAGAGFCGEYKDMPWKRESELIHLNIISLSQLTKLFLPGMIKRKRGRIVNVASTAAFSPGPLMAVYYATKSYVFSYSQSLANELKEYGITVTALCPGPTKTSFSKVSDMENVKLFNSLRGASAQDVAQYGYDAMMRGKVIAVHGWGNKLLTFSSRFAPRGLVAKVVRSYQESR